MPPNEISAKTEPNTAKPPDSTTPENTGAHQSFLRELANSAVYAAVEQPSLGIAQIISNDAMKSVKSAFSSIGIEAPKPEQFNSTGWYAQTFGGAVGMVVPFALTKVGLGKIGAFGEAATAESGMLSRRAAVGLSLKESAVTGLAYGSFLTPSDESARNAGFKSFLVDRGLSGLGSAATFTTLTAGSLALGRVAESSVAARFGLAPVLSNRLVSGTLSGLPGGFVGAEYDSISKRHTLASAPELAESMFSMAVVGGTFAGASYFSRAKPGTENIRGRANEETAQDGIGDGKAKTDARGLAPNLVPGEQAVEPGNQIKTPGDQLSTVASGDSPPVTGTVHEPPAIINPNEFKSGANTDQSVRLELTAPEQDIWRSIQQARTAEDFANISEQIFELPQEKRSWFGESLDRQGKNLSDAELNSLWPQLLQSDVHQLYRIAKALGPERTTGIWQQQLESVKQNPNPVLADELAKTMVFIEPGKQLQGLNELLNLPQPPGYLDMTSVTLAKENQLPAAKMLAEKGIMPHIETGSVAASQWTAWALDLAPGKIRDGLLDQIRRKISGSLKNPAEELNKVYKIAQEKAGPEDYETFNSMLTGITRNSGAAENVAIRTTALKDIDAKLIGRMAFYEADWAKSDQMAAQNPDLVRALAINSKFNPSIERSAYIADMMTAKPPVSVEQLTLSVIEKSRLADEQERRFLLSPGDIKALVEHGVKVAPEQVPPLLETLQKEVKNTFDLEGNKTINRDRLLTLLTLAHNLGKSNPEAFEKGFKEPIESALADPKLQYSRRLEASKALGELQRYGFDSATALQMPELRMGKIAELPPEQQTAMRKSVESALRDKEALRALFGNGALGRLMPSMFGAASEGGIVGRKQHGTHDFTLDNHLLEVVDRVGKDQDFAKLMPKDQVNVLWAALLHDIGKQENMVDFDHNRTSTSMAWGILRTLGYSDARIQRITDVMSKDADLSFNPDNRNSERLSNPAALDDVVNSYRHEDALPMVAILNRADIKSVKANEAWYTHQVDAELGKIQDMARSRVQELNKNLLPVLSNQMPQGYGGFQMSNYRVKGHSSYDLTGQLLKQRATVESPEYSMSVSLFTPENHKVYADGMGNSQNSQVIALIDGNFENLAQANRANLSTGTAIGWDGHVDLVDRWATDSKARALAGEAEQKLAKLGIPPAGNVPAENFPRLAQLRRVLGQFETYDELVAAAGAGDPYVQASDAITRILTAERDGSPLKTNNELKLNNPIVSGIGLLRKGNQPIFFEGLTQPELQELWKGNVPDFVTSGPPENAPGGALRITADVVQAARKNNLPVVILNDSSVGGH